MKLRLWPLGLALLLPVSIVGCRDATGGDPFVASPNIQGYGARTVAVVECAVHTRSGEMRCNDEQPMGAGGAARAILGQNKVRLRSSNVLYDTTTLTFGFDVRLYNLLGEPIGTPDGTTVTGSKAYYETGPVPTSFIAPYDTGTITVANADGRSRFTKVNQPYHFYNQIVQPGDSTPLKRWELKIPRSVNTFTFTLRVFTALPSEPKIPPAAPDSVPMAVYAPENRASNLTGLAGTYIRNTVTVLFMPGSTLEERQAALDQSGGTVIGGERLPDGDGLYYLAVPGDSTAATMLRTIDILNSLPQVAGATPAFAGATEEFLDYQRPTDAAGWGKADWLLDVNAAVAKGDLRWGLEAIQAPQAWGCETGSPNTRVAVVDNAFHPDVNTDVGYNVTGRVQFPVTPFATGGHGDLTSSVIGARGDNEEHISGVMWHASLTLVEYATTVFGRVPRDTASFTSLLGTKIGWAIASRAHVINISAGKNWPGSTNAKIYQGTTSPDEQRSAREWATEAGRWIKYFRELGIKPLIVFSAGNEGYDAFWNGFPQLAQKYPDQILVVAAADRAANPANGYLGGPFTRLPSSNYGPLVEIAAPGNGVGTINAFGQVVARGQTSLATPFVTGVAGLLASFDPSLSAGEMKRLIVNGAVRGNRYIENPGSTPIPVVNAYESLKMAAERPGRRLCGNRVWVANGQVYAQRVVGGSEQAEALANFSGDLDDVRVPHGGRRVDLYSYADNDYRYVKWSPSGWYSEAVSADSANAWYDNYGPTMRSFYGESHDNDSTVSYRVANDKLEVYLEARASAGEVVLGNVPFYETPALPVACVRESWRQVNGQQLDYQCIDSARPGSWTESGWPSLAYAPRGNQVLLAVSEKSHSVTIASEWYDCRRDNETDSTRVERCRNTSVSQQTRPAAIYTFATQGGQQRTLTTASVTFSDLGISDGTDEFVVSSESEVSPTILFKYVKDAQGIYISTSEGGASVRTCTSQFRRLSDAVVLKERGGCGSSTHTFAPDRRSAGAPQLHRPQAGVLRQKAARRVPTRSSATSHN